LETANAESLVKLVAENGASHVVPMDIALGIDVLPFKITREMMCEVSFWAQNQASFKAAEEIIFKVHGVLLGASTIRKVAECVGKIVFEQDREEANKIFERVNSIEYSRKKTGILYVQMDGAALNTRIKDKDGSSWRENKLGMVFSNDNVKATVNKKGETVGKILKKEYTSYVGSVGEFKKYLFACAVRNGYGQYETTIVLSDGATWIRNMCEELFPDAIQILDLFHLCENTYSFAKAIFRSDETKYIPWAEDMIDKFKNSKTKEAIELLGRYKNRKLPKGVVNLHSYVTNNIEKIDYKHYKEKGYYVGSGAIESGNKVVMQKRLKLAGMRWNEITAQYLLTLRTKFESGLWKTSVVKAVISHIFAQI
jgi:hypothetical protein